MITVCMIVQEPMVKGGIAAVVNGYRGSRLENDYKIIYVASYKDGGKLTKLLKAICGYFYFAKVLLVDKPDLVHIHSSFGPSFYRKLPFIFMASWLKKPIINHIHGADFKEFYVDANEVKKTIVKNVYKKCTILIALSSEWKDLLSQTVSADKIMILENYSILHKDALDQRFKRNCNNTVLFLGELGKRKGCYDIPAVLEQTIKEVPSAKFVLGGAGSESDETALKKLFHAKGLSNHVVFPGWVRGIEKDLLLRESDVFFLPSYNEGMPMSVLDAMGYGLPVVSTNVGGIPKVVHDGENGYCCAAGDVDAFSKGIIEILKNRNKAMKLSAASIAIVSCRYSLEQHLEQLKKIYLAVLPEF